MFFESIPLFFKHIISILQQGKKDSTSAYGSSRRVCFFQSSSLYNLDIFAEWRLGSQSVLSVPCGCRWRTEGMLLCVWICTSLLTKQLPFQSDLWHKHVKRSWDYPEGDSVQAHTAMDSPLSLMIVIRCAGCWWQCAS